MKKLISIIVIASLFVMATSCKCCGGKNADEASTECTECAEGCTHCQDSTKACADSLVACADSLVKAETVVAQ